MATNPFDLKKPLPKLSPQAYGYNPYQIGGAFGNTLNTLFQNAYQRKLQEQSLAQQNRQQQVNTATAGYVPQTPEGTPPTTAQMQTYVNKGTGLEFAPKPKEVFDNEIYGYTADDPGNLKLLGTYKSSKQYQPTMLKYNTQDELDVALKKARISALGRQGTQVDAKHLKDAEYYARNIMKDMMGEVPKPTDPGFGMLNMLGTMYLETVGSGNVFDMAAKKQQLDARISDIRQNALAAKEAGVTEEFAIPSAQKALGLTDAEVNLFKLIYGK